MVPRRSCSPVTRAQCRLVLQAFCGRQEALAELLRGPLSVLPPGWQRFWRATAAAAAGRAAEAHTEFLDLESSTDQTLRAAASRRLRHPPLPPREPLSATSLGILLRAETGRDQDERFSVQRSPGGSRAWATWVLLGLNVAVFAVEIGRGGSMNMGALRKLGAVDLAALRDGQWWRLATNSFLHFGPAHLGMNLLALGWLGPFVEWTVGRAWFVLVYLAAGLGASATVMLLLWSRGDDEALVGASGCIMGLVGATLAIALRGWRRERARAASRLLRFLTIVIVSQCVFDLLIPQVSMTAHLAGLAGGFLFTSLLPRHRPAEVRGGGTMSGKALS